LRIANGFDVGLLLIGEGGAGEDGEGDGDDRDELHLDRWIAARLGG